MAPKPSWANLPSELLATIATFLHTRIDNRRFRSVCSSWRSSAPSYQNPIKFPFDLPLKTTNQPLSHFHLTEKTIYCVEPLTKSSSSENSLLIAVEELEGGKAHLINPFTGLRVEPLPPLFPTKLNLFDFHVTELQKLYRLESEVIDNGIQQIRLLLILGKKIMVRKVICLSNPTNDETTLVVLQEEKGNLSFFQLGGAEWVLVKDIGEDGYPFEDIANYKGNLCAIREDGHAIIIDSSFNVTEIARQTLTEHQPLALARYLIESSGDLFLAEQHKDVVGCSGDALAGIDRKFKVYKLHVHEDEYKWIEVTNLGDCVFITDYQSAGYWSFSLSPSRTPLCLRNCIVSYEPVFDLLSINRNDYKVDQVFVFNVELTGAPAFLPLLGGGDEMFWPPPKWLASGNPSHH